MTKHKMVVMQVKEIALNDGSKVFDLYISMDGMDAPMEISLNARNMTEAMQAVLKLKEFMDEYTTELVYWSGSYNKSLKIWRIDHVSNNYEAG